MKNFIAVFISFLMPLLIHAQAEVTIPEPEEPGRVVLVKNSSEGIMLPIEEGRLDQSMRTFGINGIEIPVNFKTKMYINHPSAETRIKYSLHTKFIVRPFDNDSLPLENIEVIKFDKKKKKRISELSNVTLFSKTTDKNLHMMEYHAEEYGDYSYLITLDYLNEGEYGIYVIDPNDNSKKVTYHFLTFGVDY